MTHDGSDDDWSKFLDEDALIADAVPKAQRGDPDALRFLLDRAPHQLIRGHVSEPLAYFLADLIGRVVAGFDPREVFGTEKMPKPKGRPAYGIEQQNKIIFPLAAAIVLFERIGVAKTEAVSLIADFCGPAESTIYEHLRYTNYAPMRNLRTPELWRIAKPYRRALLRKRS
ncbi:hypothetical protein P3T23_006172 [Paraburkholderia sp. GAS448]|uniref:hypothetical protein n=1 Tax=Paraburkholderia sp. GAS448 TaxID=3035136 RepID=UPI003D240C60